jgi:uncharacterized membrane protein YebE (DUF533 family)
MKKYISYAIVIGFGAWAYNQYRKNKSENKPKIK